MKSQSIRTETLIALQLLVESELQTDLDHPIMFLGDNLFNVLKEACIEFKVDVK